MGIIRKQGLQGSASLYAGVFIGFVTTALLFPKILNPEQIGLLNTLVSYSTVFAQFATLGFTSVIIRNFSYFRDYKNRHNHFFFLVFWVMVIGSTLSVLAYFLLKPIIVAQNIINAPLFVEYIDYLIPLIVFTLVFFILDTYYTVLYKTVRGIILKEVLQRILILIALLLLLFQFISFKCFTVAYVVALAVPGIIMIIFIIAEGEWVISPKLDFISKDLSRSMFSVGLFGILTSLVGSANLQIDRAMASSMISLEATGIYTTVFIFASLITVPSRALLKIASAVIAEAWKRNDKEEIAKIFKNTCLNQYIIALLVFIGLWGNIDNIFRILPPEYLSGKYVIFWLGLAYTIEMASGASNQIIASSPDYKVFTWMAVIRLALMVVTNLIFIPLFQVTGIAIAAAVSYIIFAIIRLAYIKLRYKIYPYHIKFVYLTAIGILVYFVSDLLPQLNNLYLDITIRSLFITFFFLILITIFKISDELNLKLKKTLKRIFS
ncbi:MAG: oligosaccharide flippase family protein [Bacteroidales bacterium]